MKLPGLLGNRLSVAFGKGWTVANKLADCQPGDQIELYGVLRPQAGGGSRFLLDVLHNGLGWDLGGLNAVVEFSFLNFSVILFFVSVGLIFWLSRPSERAEPSKLTDVTLDWQTHAAEVAGRTTEKIMTGIVGVAIVGLWAYFG